MGDARRQQGVGSTLQRRARRDDVVDEQHRETLTGSPGTKPRTGQPFGSRLPGLGRAVRPIEQSAARNAEPPGDGAGDDLGLVVAAPANPTATGRCPSDDIDRRELQPADHLRGEHVGGATAVTELQRHDQLAGDTVEGKRRSDPLRRAQLTC